jgi:hypothetical protein
LSFWAEDAKAWPPRLALVGTGDYSHLYSYDSNLTYTPQWGLPGFGALLDFSTSGKLSFEAGALYVLRSFSDGVDPVATMPTLEFSLYLRYWFSRYFSWGAGPYYTQAYGDIRFAGTQATSSYSSFGLESYDIGVGGSLAFYLPLSNYIGIYADGRYTMSLMNAATAQLQAVDTQASFHFRDIVTLVGIRFNLAK